MCSKIVTYIEYNTRQIVSLDHRLIIYFISHLPINYMYHSIDIAFCSSLLLVFLLLTDNGL